MTRVADRLYSREHHLQYYYEDYVVCAGVGAVVVAVAEAASVGDIVAAAHSRTDALVACSGYALDGLQLSSTHLDHANEFVAADDDADDDDGRT